MHGVRVAAACTDGGRQRACGQMPSQLLALTGLLLATAAAAGGGAPSAAALVDPPRLVTFTQAVQFANPVTPNCSLGWFFDTGQLFINVGGVVRGYGSNQQAHLMVNGTDIDSLVELRGGAETGLCSGTEMVNASTGTCNTVRVKAEWEGAYDDCGAWLNSAIVEDDNLTVHGWYHSEAMCNYSGGFTNKSMSYAKSTDGGLHFSKPAHPENVILRSPPHNISTSCEHCTDEGDATIVKDGDWLYMHFMEWHGWHIDAAGSNNAGGFSAGVARSKLSDRGLPGTWYKWYNGAWMEPAVGGQATAIPVITGAHVYLLEEEGLNVCLGYRQIPQGQTAGPRLSWAAFGDHTTWVQSAEPLWAEATLSGTYDYPSLTGRFGSAGMKVGDGKVIYEYGVYFPPAWSELDWCTILFRHPIATYRSVPVSEVPGASTTPRVAALIALPSYVSAAANDTWTTTGIEVAMAPVNMGYTRAVANVAWILTSNTSHATRGMVRRRCRIVWGTQHRRRRQRDRATSLQSARTRPHALIFLGSAGRVRGCVRLVGCGQAKWPGRKGPHCWRGPAPQVWSRWSNAPRLRTIWL